MEISPVGQEIFHADGRTDRRTDTMKLTVAFSNFANACNKTAQHQNLILKTFRRLRLLPC